MRQANIENTPDRPQQVQQTELNQHAIMSGINTKGRTNSSACYGMDAPRGDRFIMRFADLLRLSASTSSVHGAFNRQFARRSLRGRSPGEAS